MSFHNLVDVQVRDLENSVLLLNSLVESYKLEMALLHRKHAELLDAVHAAIQLLEDGRPESAHDKLTAMTEPPMPKADPVVAEIERVT